MGKIIAFSVFAIIFLTHLIAILLDKRKVVDITKCFIVASIIAILAVYKVTNIALYFALAFGLIGDLLLIFMEKEILFTLGLVSFAINHLCYFVAFLIAFDFALPFYCYIIYGCVLILSILLLKNPFKKLHPSLFLAGSFYFGLLFVELAFAITFFALKVSNYSLSFLPMLGSMLFIGSDTILALTNFKKHFKNDNFYVMLTYGLAQFLLALGIGLVAIL